MGLIRTDKLAAGTIVATSTIYTSPTGTRTRFARLRLQYVTAPAGTYTINLASGATTVRILTTVNPAAGSLLDLVLDDRLSAGDLLSLGVPAASSLRYWLSGTTYVD